MSNHQQLEPGKQISKRLSSIKLIQTLHISFIITLLSCFIKYPKQFFMQKLYFVNVFSTMSFFFIEVETITTLLMRRKLQKEGKPPSKGGYKKLLQLDNRKLMLN